MQADCDDEVWENLASRLELANRADLARVRGIGGVFSDLLDIF